MNDNEQSPVSAIFVYLKKYAVFLGADENKLVESIETFYRDRGFVSHRQQNCILGYYNLVERILRARAISLEVPEANGTSRQEAMMGAHAESAAEEPVIV